VHRFAATGASRSFFDFQSSFAEDKLSIADLALVALLAVFCFAELIKCI
jgi:glutathione S-transferase